MANTNQERDDRAEIALQKYIESKGEVFERSSSEIADLMADLLHLTARIDQGEDPVESTIRLAKLHFQAERAEEAEAA